MPSEITVQYCQMKFFSYFFLKKYIFSSAIPETQINAFRNIVDLLVHHPVLRQVFLKSCENHRTPIEAITFSWRRASMQCDSAWLLYYRLATLCLTANRVTSIAEELVQHQSAWGSNAKRLLIHELAEICG